jgi:type I restriction enzyme S subunit
MKNVYFNEVVDFLEGPGVRNWQFTDSGIKLINIRNLVNDEINLTKTTTHLGIEEVTNKYSHFLLQEGDYVMASSGVTWGKIAEVKKEHLPLCLNTSIIKLKPKYNDFEKKYLWYFIKSSVFTNQIDKIITGSAQPNFGPTHLKKIKIPLPSLETQKRIAQILDDASALRDKTEQLLKEYDALAQSIFLDMFGDPVNNRYKFPIGTIRDLVKEAKYGTSEKATDEGEYQYLRMNNLTYEGYMDYSSMKFVNILKKDLHKYLVEKGDLLFNRTNSKELVGKTAIFDSSEPMVIAGYLIRVRFNEKANSYFVSYYLNSKYGKLILRNMCKSIVGMANINAQELQNILILHPPIELQNKFAKKIALIEQQKRLAKQELKESQDLFNCLLQKAFKGELV